MRHKLRVAMLAACVFCFSSTAKAQIFNTGQAGLARQMPNIYGPYLANISRVRVLKKRGKLSPTSRTPAAPRGGGSQSPQRQPSNTSGGGVSSPVTATTFSPVQSPFVPQQLASKLGKTPEERQYIEGVLTKCLDFYTDNNRRNGLPLNDVARALNYYISTNYYIYSEGRGPSPAQMRAAREDIRANMVEDENFRRMTDRQKQEAYETMIVLAGFVDLGYGTAKKSGNADTAEQFRKMAVSNLETLLGASVENIRFTDEGLQLN